MSTNFVIVNNFSTSLASPITSTTATTMSISSTTNAPTLTAGQIWPITLNDAATGNIYEIVYCTARSGSTCTIVRGQEGTAATTWLANDLAYADSTAGILNNFALVNGSSSQNFAVAALSMTGALTGPTTGVFSSYFTAPILTMPYASLAGSASTVYAANDNGATNGMMFNVPTGSTNGFQFLVNNLQVARITNAGAVSSVTGILSSTTTALTLGAASTSMISGIKIFTASTFTDIGWNGASAINTIAASAFGIDTGGTTNLFTMDTSGNLGVLGTVHATSRRELKQRIEYIDPSEALDIVLATKVARYDFVTEEPQENGQSRHASFIADETPWQLSGGPGYEHADAQKTASYALAAISALNAKVEAYMDAHP